MRSLLLFSSLWVFGLSQTHTYSRCECECKEHVWATGGGVARVQTMAAFPETSQANTSQLQAAVLSSSATQATEALPPTPSASEEDSSQLLAILPSGSATPGEAMAQATPALSTPEDCSQPSSSQVQAIAMSSFATPEAQATRAFSATPETAGSDASMENTSGVTSGAASKPTAFNTTAILPLSSESNSSMTDQEMSMSCITTSGYNMPAATPPFRNSTFQFFNTTNNTYGFVGSSGLFPTPTAINITGAGTISRYMDLEMFLVLILSQAAAVYMS